MTSWWWLNELINSIQSYQTSEVINADILLTFYILLNSFTDWNCKKCLMSWEQLQFNGFYLRTRNKTNQPMNQPMNEWTNQWTNQWTNKPMNEQTNESTYKQMNEWPNQWTKWTNEWMKQWTGFHPNFLLKHFSLFLCWLFCLLQTLAWNLTRTFFLSFILNPVSFTPTCFQFPWCIWHLRLSLWRKCTWTKKLL